MEGMEPPVLDYARGCGLSQDYKSVPALHLHEQRYFRLERVPEPSKLPPMLRSDFALPEDKWSIHTPAASFLRDSLVSDVTAVIRPTSPPPHRKLKLEPPLLTSDDQADYDTFLARHRAGMLSIPVTIKSLAPEPLTTSQLEWPLLDDDLVHRISREAVNEKWQVTAGMLAALKEITSPKPPDVSIDLGISKLRVQRMSSPILPLSPTPLSPAVDSTELDILFTSTPADPTESQVKTLEDAIVHEDIQPIDSEHGDQISLMIPNDTTSTSERILSPLKRPRPDDLKMDTPLMPASEGNSPFKKVRFSDLVDHVDQMPRASSSAGSEDYEQFFESVVDLSQAASEAIERETLSESDATLRISVPSLRDDHLSPPWTMVVERSNASGKLHGMNGQHDSLQEVFAQIGDDEKKWPLQGILRRLPWTPVPLQDFRDIVDHGIQSSALDQIFSSLAISDNDLSKYCWKPDGFRILDDSEDDEDDLEGGSFAADDLEVSTLVQGHFDKHIATATIGLRERALRALNQPDAALGASSALDNFFHLQTGHMPDPPPTRGRETEVRMIGQHFDTAAIVEHGPASQGPAQSAPSVEKGIRDVPFDPRTAPRQAIVTTGVLNNRHLLQNLCKRLPSTALTERDFALNEEADIIPCPSKGIILSTLQKLKQRPLPGVRDQTNPVSSRVTSLSSRYEQLIVLISEALPMPKHAAPPSPRELDATDTAAINALTNLGASLECNVHVLYVPGTETELVLWLAAEMCNGYSPDLDIDLPVEDTPQETLLRKAGMNAFAAGMVLGSRAPMGGTHGQTAGGSGLADFVLAGAAERRRMYGVAMGGTRVLDRVSRAMDQCWRAVAAGTTWRDSAGAGEVGTRV
ncbi:hypothetical protein CAC42_5438 [Sphaceloma murrayae]|uniref:Uncharacterized protein n=1 Tax=Sphaceloma murrayae TaxID=2082308 RepID=A0A2K1QV53_9PEZI|nr:hypothetical protein CAC42_5438 [Sphaceloma murrayae]